MTCGIDHVPPPLLQQLKAGGLMVIPVGPPGAQRVLKVAKTQGADGSITTSREDIYGGKIVPFVPFTKLDGDKIVGTHNADAKTLRSTGPRAASRGPSAAMTAQQRSPP